MNNTPTRAFKLHPAVSTKVVPAVEVDEANFHPEASQFHPLRNGFSDSGKTAAPSVELWPLAEAVLRRWRWLLLGGVLLALGGFLLGWAMWKPHYSVSAQLIRYDSPNAQEVFGFRQVTAQTLASVLRAPELLRRVAEQARPRMSMDALAETLKVTPDRNSELLTVTVFGTEAEPLVGLVNLYAHDAARFTGEVQAKAATEVRDYQRHQVRELEGEIATVSEQLRTSQEALARKELLASQELLARQGMLAVPQSGSGRSPSLVSARLAPMLERLSAARGELVDLLARYTEAHPFVKEQHAKIAAIERQVKEFNLTAVAAPVEEPVVAAEKPAPSETIKPAASEPAKPVPVRELADVEVLRSKLLSLENGRLLVLGRERTAQLFAENPPGFFRVFAEATPKDVAARSPRLKVISLTVFCAVLGAALAASLVLWRELSDDRLRGASDVRRVAQLPVIAGLGDLDRMSPAERGNWAFRTWTALQSRLSPSPNHGLVCGVTSAGEGEGRTTWMNLIAEAATKQGFRVLTIATERPAAAPDSPVASKFHAAEPATGTNSEPLPAGFDSTSAALVSTNVLASPGEVTERLTGPNSQPLVHIPLPGWVWNLERRKQWKEALGDWSRIDNIVILVELPPASQPEAVLLGANLPNLIWLADCDSANAAQTRTDLETLRNARCNLVGAVVNHEQDSLLKNAFPRWLGRLDGTSA